MEEESDKVFKARVDMYKMWLGIIRDTEAQHQANMLAYIAFLFGVTQIIISWNNILPVQRTFIIIAVVGWSLIVGYIIFRHEKHIADGWKHANELTSPHYPIKPLKRP